MKKKITQITNCNILRDISIEKRGTAEQPEMWIIPQFQFGINNIMFSETYTNGDEIYNTVFIKDEGDLGNMYPGNAAYGTAEEAVAKLETLLSPYFPNFDYAPVLAEAKRLEELPTSNSTTWTRQLPDREANYSLRTKQDALNLYNVFEGTELTGCIYYEDVPGGYEYSFETTPTSDVSSYNQETKKWEIKTV